MPSLRSIVDPLGVLPRAAHLADAVAGATGEAAGNAAVAAVERVLAGPELDRVVAAVLDSPGLQRLTTQVLEHDATKRLVLQVVDSPLLDAIIDRLLDQDELWVLVDEVARSPSVTEAIAHQGVGFADQVAGEVGRRSRRADVRLERVARRMLHREPAPDDPLAVVLRPPDTA